MTDLINSYVAEGQLAFEFVTGWWQDAGTFDSLHLASLFFSKASEKRK